MKRLTLVEKILENKNNVVYFKSKKNLLNASKLFTNKYKKYWSVMSKTI